MSHLRKVQAFKIVGAVTAAVVIFFSSSIVFFASSTGRRRRRRCRVMVVGLDGDRRRRAVGMPVDDSFGRDQRARQEPCEVEDRGVEGGERRGRGGRCGTENHGQTSFLMGWGSSSSPPRYEGDPPTRFPAPPGDERSGLTTASSCCRELELSTQPPLPASSLQSRESERELVRDQDGKKSFRSLRSFSKSTELFFFLSLAPQKTKKMALLASHAQCRDLVISGRPQPCLLLELDEGVLGEVLRDGCVGAMQRERREDDGDGDGDWTTDAASLLLRFRAIKEGLDDPHLPTLGNVSRPGCQRPKAAPKKCRRETALRALPSSSSLFLFRFPFSDLVKLKNSFLSLPVQLF